MVHYFSSHLTAFGFWASSPPDNITLNPANKKTDQSLSEFHTGIGAAAHATLDEEHLISHTRTVLVDTVPLYRVLMVDLLQLQNAWTTY